MGVLAPLYTHLLAVPVMGASFPDEIHGVCWPMPTQNTTSTLWYTHVRSGCVALVSVNVCVCVCVCVCVSNVT